MVTPPVAHISWPQTHRLVLSRFPRIDLFDDIADPHDWEALAAPQARTNPRTYEEIGDLSRVPPDRRLSGDGASWVMACFTHVSPDRKSRFSDGAYGVYYAARDFETALREHTHHIGVFYADAGMEAGWHSEVRQLVGAIDADLTDIRGEGFEVLLLPDDYAAPQALGAALRADGCNGVVYPSVRHPGGECVGAFYPDVVAPPIQGDHFRYYWDGTAIRYARKISGDRSIFDLAGAD